jgi:hypothetical protein
MVVIGRVASAAWTLGVFRRFEDSRDDAWIQQLDVGAVRYKDGPLTASEPKQDDRKAIVLPNECHGYGAGNARPHLVRDAADQDLHCHSSLALRERLDVSPDEAKRSVIAPRSTSQPGWTRSAMRSASSSGLTGSAVR